MRSSGSQTGPLPEVLPACRFIEFSKSIRLSSRERAACAVTTTLTECGARFKLAARTGLVQAVLWAWIAETVQLMVQDALNSTAMADCASSGLNNLLKWKSVYREVELYKAAVRVYTKPLFHWRKALGTSTDGKTLYDLAGRGLRSLDSIHRSLRSESFEFRPAVARKYNFNGKRRTLYIAPWEERIVDLLLYRILSLRLHSWMSPCAYAYRERGYGLDRCQTRIAETLRAARSPQYVAKRDIADYFPSIDHAILLEKCARLIDRSDYLFRLIQQRITFSYEDETGAHTAGIGVPFGCAIACLFANVYLTDLDRRLEAIESLSYFRYSDDILLISRDRETAQQGIECLEHGLQTLKLRSKASHEANIALSRVQVSEPGFTWARELRHLGLLFRAGGDVSLSRDKRRKIQNLFAFAFRRARRRWRKIGDPQERARLLAAIAAEAVEEGVRNVAILDYYLKHIDDEEQLRLLDRWLAEEVLSLVFGGHKKSHFRKISFGELRAMGLPSLVHRRRLIRNGRVESPFFIWQRQKATRAFRGTVARLLRTASADAAFSPHPEAAANQVP